MATEIRVPTLGESVSEAIVGRWFKKVGDAIAADEPLVELETDKVTVEVPAPAAGTLSAIIVADGATVGVGAVLGEIGEGGGAAAISGGGAVVGTAAVTAMAPSVSVEAINSGPERMAERPPAEQAARERTVQREQTEVRPDEAPVARGAAEVAAATAPQMPPSPSARKMIEEAGIEASAIDGSGKRGQVLKGDVLAALNQSQRQETAPAGPAETRAPAEPQPSAEARAPAPPQPRAPASPSDEAREERVRMTRLRQTIARRLKEAQNAAAMLTTFNDVDMTAVMALRRDYREIFEKKHGVRLGFMGFFVKACVQALKDIPAVNAEIDGTDIVYKNYYHIGVAVGTEKGLVVPVVRDADTLSIAAIEKRINEFGKRARDGQLTIQEMQGGTFTISNGGVYGSLMSTPILNAPQSGILGMHRIEERPVVKDGAIVARPMMYLALSYDHRIVDGREAVTFLVRVKEAVEDPQRLVLDL